MPRRTNTFQELIELLERQLASSGAQVFGSHLLKDSRTGEDREVDVVIETQAGIHPLRIGIEITDRKRPVSSTWIEGIAKKHEDLPIDKSVAVSRSGFYKPAQRKARALKIDALSLEEAKATDWKAKLDSLPSIKIESFLLPYLTKATLIIMDEDSLEDCKDLDIANLELYRSTGESRGTLSSCLQRFLTGGDFIRAVRERAFTDAGTIVAGEISLETGSYIIGSDGTKHEVSAIQFEAKCKKEVASAELQRGRYRDVAVILAAGASFGHPVNMVFTEKPDEDPLASVRISKSGKGAE